MADYGTGASKGDGQESIGTSTAASKRKLKSLKSIPLEDVPF